MEVKQSASEKVKQLKKEIIKTSVMMASVAAVILFASIAWYAANKKVHGMIESISSANGSGVEILTEDTIPDTSNNDGMAALKAFLGLGNKATETTRYLQSGKTYEDPATSSKTTTEHRMYTTTAENSTTEWALTSETNFGNFANKDSIDPGSYGKLEFYLVPNISGDISVNIDLDIESYLKLNSLPTISGISEDKIKKISTSSNTSYILDSDYADAEKTLAGGKTEYGLLAENIVDGHILCFTNRTDTPTTRTDDEGTVITEHHYTYSGLIRKTLTVSLDPDGSTEAASTTAYTTADADGKEISRSTLPYEVFCDSEGKTYYKFTIYWVWPTELENEICSDTADFVRDETCYMYPTVRKLLVSEIATSATGTTEESLQNTRVYWYLYNNSSTRSAVYQYADATTLGNISASDNIPALSPLHTAYENLSEMYDKADDFIGEKIGYVCASVKVTLSNQ